MNITSNLKPGQYLNPEPLARLLAEPIYQAIKAEREQREDDYKEDDGNDSVGVNGIRGTHGGVFG